MVKWLRKHWGCPNTGRDRVEYRGMGRERGAGGERERSSWVRRDAESRERDPLQSRGRRRQSREKQAEDVVSACSAHFSPVSRPLLKICHGAPPPSPNIPGTLAICSRWVEAQPGSSESRGSTFRAGLHPSGGEEGFGGPGSTSSITPLLCTGLISSGFPGWYTGLQASITPFALFAGRE